MYCDLSRVTRPRSASQLCRVYLVTLDWNQLFGMKRVLSLGDICNVPGEDDAPFTQVRGRRKRTKKQLSGVQSDNNNIAQHEQTQPSTSTTTNDDRNALANELQVLRKSVDELLHTVEVQKSEINRLSSQLTNVLSYLNINEDNHTAPGTTTSDGASISRREHDSSTTPASHRPTSFRDAVVAAVYQDQNIKTSRANSVVVSGLAQRADCSDQVIFQELCQTELNLTVSVRSTKRLGTSISGRIQPLLVVLPTTSLADEILIHAKELRKSRSNDIKSNVYINPNLTRLEARAAYEQRCRRREQRLQKQQKKRQPNDGQVGEQLASTSSDGMRQQRPHSGRVFTRSTVAVASVAPDEVQNDRATSHIPAICNVRSNIGNESQLSADAPSFPFPPPPVVGQLIAASSTTSALPPTAPSLSATAAAAAAAH